MITILTLLPGLAVGLLVGYLSRKLILSGKKNSLEAQIEKRLTESKTAANKIILEAEEKALKLVNDSKKEERNRRQKLEDLERNLSLREIKIDERFAVLEKRYSFLKKQAKNLRQAKVEIQNIRKKQLKTLEKIAGLNRSSAKDILLKMVEEDMGERLVRKIYKFKQKEQLELEKQANELISRVIQKCAINHTVEHTTSTVSLPNEEMKGRIIGREGRNITTIEKLTGTEIVVDDTPEVVTISAFSPIRRQVAKRALEKLIQDGRIHPAKIEEYIMAAKKELAVDIKEAGEAALYELGVPSLPVKLIQLLGRLKYRTSYGQNVLQHSIEVARLSENLAKELGGDAKIAKLAGILHDIGKAVDDEIKGTHIEIGVNILNKFEIQAGVVSAVAGHHGGLEQPSLEAIIVATADSISGSRIGARNDSYEDYIKRLEDLEKIAAAFTGVQKTYAVQAGRELRIFVNADTISDLQALKLARDIADKIEAELRYPGEIKVNVIRETRAIEFAR